MINSICIIWYSWLVYPWVTLPISMGHIKLKAFFLGHWSMAISYRCRLDRTFIYNTRTQLKAQKSIMEMLYFFRNILRYATLEIFNLWMNDGNKTNFLHQIKYTSIFKWEIQMPQMRSVLTKCPKCPCGMRMRIWIHGQPCQLICLDRQRE